MYYVMYIVLSRVVDILATLGTYPDYPAIRRQQIGISDWASVLENFLTIIGFLMFASQSSLQRRSRNFGKKLLNSVEVGCNRFTERDVRGT